MIRLLTYGALLLTAAQVAACGRLGANYTGLRLVPPKTASTELEPPGTPARTVLEFFLALQRSNSEAAARFYAPTAGVTPTTIRLQRSAAAGRAFFSRTQPPRVLDVAMTDRRATVFTALDVRWTAPNGRTVVWTQPQAFELVNKSGGWKLTDDYFLKSLAAVTPSAPCSTC